MTAILPAPSATAIGCQHTPACPAAEAVDHDAARVVRHDYTAGYSTLCNGVICFDDTGELVGTTPIEPHRPEPRHRASEENHA